MASAAFEVGYESATQFRHEYARAFGLPPARDSERLLATYAPRAEGAPSAREARSSRAARAGREPAIGAAS